jgi:hypothetical protein
MKKRFKILIILFVAFGALYILLKHYNVDAEVTSMIGGVFIGMLISSLIGVIPNSIKQVKESRKNKEIQL